MFYQKDKKCFYSYVDWSLVKISNVRLTPEVLASWFQTKPLDQSSMISWMNETRILLRFYKQNGEKDRHRYQYKRFNCPSDYYPDWQPKVTLFIMIEQYPFNQMNMSTVQPSQDVACGLPGCGFRTPRKDKLARHRNQCRNETEVKTKRKVYGEKVESSNPIIKFVVYDLETVEKSSSKAEAKLELLSIGLASNICGYQSKYFCRKSDNSLDGQELVDRFLNHIFELKSQFDDNLDPEIVREYEEVNEKLRDTSRPWSEKRLLFTRKQQLKEQLKLSVYGFNSSKFDMKVLLSYLVTYAKNKNLKIEVLKKGAIYFNLTLDGIIFKGL